MKKLLSLILSLLLTLGLLSGLPAARAEDSDLPPWLSDEARAFALEMMEMFGCTPAPGGEVRTSELEPGKNYVFWEAVELVIDKDYSSSVLCAYGGFTIRGDAVLTVEILNTRSACDMESGTVVCPVMENPPDDDTTVHNGITAYGGVRIKGGSLSCPVISAGPETVHVSGGEVQAGTINALFGYSQSDGSVKAGYIFAREGFSISGGFLDVDSISSYFINFDGGVTLLRSVDGVSGPEEQAAVSIRFPMMITEPAGVRYRDGRFVDRDGNTVPGTKRIEKVEVDCPFTDVAESSYVYRSMLWAYYFGITSGTDATHFSPKMLCTRAQLVTFLWKAAGSPEPESTSCPFLDVPADAYYYKAVLWAAENGITAGKTESTFAPKETCTRAQLLTFLWRSQGSPVVASYYDPNFTDVPKDAYYYKAVCWFASKGIVFGTSEDCFSPKNPCSRGQAVVFLERVFG